jgi:hypothetical protein
MKNIQAIKVGNVVNLSIDGKLHKKNCGSPKEADELFRKILLAKQDPTDANVKQIYSLINEKTRIAMMAGLENDVESGEVFLAGFNTPIPMILVDVIKEYHENNYPIDAIVNFWKLLMINPDIRVRESLFNFIQKHDFVLTDNGYMIVYKAVDLTNTPAQIKDPLPEFVSNQYLHVKKEWKCSPNKYVVYRKLTDIKDVHGELFITKIETAEGWNEKEQGVEILGKLGDLFNRIYNSEVVEERIVYTDHYSHKFKIMLGEAVHMERKKCDSDPAKECSYGLHVGATKYVERMYQSSPAILVCYVNPANVVAVPDYDHSKMRVTEYFPFALATYKNGKIDIIEEKYFESDYRNIEQKKLELMINKVKANEVPIEKAIKAEEEERPMSELMKILETRMFDLEMPVEE